MKDGRNLLSHLLRMRAPSNTGRTIPTSRRIAVSGPPGVGKSTWLEAVGMRLVSDGHKVAILAIDPSSPVTGGSLLGDRTRMPQLSNHPSCYIRPSPSGGSMGGVAQRTMEVIHLVEAAGYGYIYIVDAYAFVKHSLAVASSSSSLKLTRTFCRFDYVLVETVGVGQSEVIAADLVDCMLVLLPPSGGDELQGIKKGMV